MEPIETALAPEIVESIAITTTNGPVVVEELLIEEISIDGMCGVY